MTAADGAAEIERGAGARFGARFGGSALVVLVPLALLCLWEAAGAAGLLPTGLIPTPTMVPTTNAVAPARLRRSSSLAAGLASVAAGGVSSAAGRWLPERALIAFRVLFCWVRSRWAMVRSSDPKRGLVVTQTA